MIKSSNFKGYVFSLKVFSQFIFLMFVIFFSYVGGAGQTRNSLSRATIPSGHTPGAPAGSYPLSGFENVNLFNGNLNFHLPLLRIGGRGKAGFTAMLKIDSKQWDVDSNAYTYSGAAYYGSWNDNTFKLSPGTMSVRNSVYGVDGCTAYPGVEIYDSTQTRFSFKTTDGTEYEFYDVLTNGKVLGPSGRCGDGLSEVRRGREWKSTEGSATFITDEELYDYIYVGGYRSVASTSDGRVFPVTGYLILQDGTRYRIEDEAVKWIQDTNGNRITITGSQVTDSLSRTYSLSSEGTYNKIISFKGESGEFRKIKILYSPLNEILRSDYPLPVKTYLELFPSLSFSSTTPFNPYLVSAVELPDGRKYEFKYNYYGELARVKLPTGGVYEYDWERGSTADIYGITFDSIGYTDREPDRFYNVYRRVIEKRIYKDDGILEGKTLFSVSHPQSYDPKPWITTALVEHRDANNITYAGSRHYFHGSPDAFFTEPFGSNNWDDAREYRTEVLSSDLSRILRTTETVWENGLNGPERAYTGNNIPGYNVHQTKELTTLLDGSSALVSSQRYQYDEFNNRTDVWEYDFGSGMSGALLRHTQTSYLRNNPHQNDFDYANDPGIHIRNLPKEIKTFDGNESLVSKATFDYDLYDTQPLKDTPNIVQHNAAYNIGYGTRGNLTKRSQLSSISQNTYVDAYNQYDIAGNVVKTTDGKGSSSLYDFSDRFGIADSDARGNAGATELGGMSTYAFHSKVTNALGQEVYMQYDYYLGLPVNNEDINGTVSSFYYNDLLDRPTQVINAINISSSKSQLTFSYNDAARTITTTSDLKVYGDNKLKSEFIYDGLGRTIESRKYEASSDYIKSLTEYDEAGRAFRTSNQHRPGENLNWTATEYDSLGRAIKVTLPDQTTVNSSYNGNHVIVVDQAGKKQFSESDALGRLIKVIEDPGGLNYETFYTYNAQDKLIRVVQGSQSPQIRTFTYDTTSRMISSSIPESGITTYSYDSVGNLIEKTDARTVKSTMTYDALNRIKSKSYSGVTSEGIEAASLTKPVYYFYDDYSTLPSGAPTWTGTPSKGRPIAITYDNGTDGSYFKYDSGGMVLINHQRIGSANYATTYGYNLAGNVTYEYRGKRRRTLMSYDDAGRLTKMDTSATPFLAYATVLHSRLFNSNGGIKYETYGNGLLYSTNYNERQQLTEIKLGKSDNSELLLKLGYVYGSANNQNDSDDLITTQGNNGNIGRIHYSINGALQYSQTYLYDGLNRLQKGVEHNNGVLNDSSRAWYQTFDYDRFGNRGINAANTSNNLNSGNSALQLSEFSQANNRITRSGYVYDSVGNLIAEPGKTYKYDAESRIVNAIVEGGATGEYVYDGSGYRVKKRVSDATSTSITRFEYGAGGELIAEYDDSSGLLKKEYLYSDSGLLATIEPGNIYQYVTSDHLGSPRVWTNSSGNVAEGGRHDYAPFGEELTAGFGVRTSTYGYAPSIQFDKQRNQYTGYEKDLETGLDFAQARYYNNFHGRFTSVDPLLSSARPNDPQSWNRYSYVGNRPFIYTDPSGQKWYYSSSLNVYQHFATLPDKGQWTEVDYETVYKAYNGMDVILTRDKNGKDVWDYVQGPKQPLVSPELEAAMTKGFMGFVDLFALKPLKAALTGGVSVAGEVADFVIEAEFGGDDTSTTSTSGSVTVDGVFSIIDWKGYPSGAAKPEGPFTLGGKGDQWYDDARKAASSENQKMRKQIGGLDRGVEVHEIHPVQFGGHPTARHNKVVLSKPVHNQFSVFWKNMSTALRKGK